MIKNRLQLYKKAYIRMMILTKRKNQNILKSLNGSTYIGSTSRATRFSNKGYDHRRISLLILVVEVDTFISKIFISPFCRTKNTKIIIFLCN